MLSFRGSPERHCNAAAIHFQVVHERSSEPSEDQTSISQSLDLHFEAVGTALGIEGILAGVGLIATEGTSCDLFVPLGPAGVSHVYTICN